MRSANAAILFMHGFASYAFRFPPDLAVSGSNKCRMSPHSLTTGMCTLYLYVGVALSYTPVRVPEYLLIAIIFELNKSCQRHNVVTRDSVSLDTAPMVARNASASTQVFSSF